MKKNTWIVVAVSIVVVIILVIALTSGRRGGSSTNTPTNSSTTASAAISMNQDAKVNNTTWKVTKAETSSVVKGDLVTTAPAGKMFLKVTASVASDGGAKLDLFGNYKLKVTDNNSQSYDPLDMSLNYVTSGTAIVRASGATSPFTLEEIFEVDSSAKGFTLGVQYKPLTKVLAQTNIALDAVTQSTANAVLPEMTAFVTGMNGKAKTVSALLNTYGKTGLDDKDMNLYDLKDAAIYYSGDKSGQTCYQFSATSGMTTRHYEVCWLSGKIQSVDDLGL